MEDARALLDSLMGQTRDVKKDKRQKASGGNGFKHESVCKLYLVGFCPEHEQLFHNTRRDLGTCSKTHFDVHKREFNEHADKAKYQAAYEAQLLDHLSSILRRRDEWILREKAVNEAALAKSGARAPGLNAGVSKLRDKASKSIAEAEQLASKGDIEASKQLVNAAQEYEKKAKEYEDQEVSQGSQMCDICGGIKDSGRVSFKHEEGKVHQGILSITRMHKDLKKKEAKGELKVDKDIEEEERKDKEREAKERRAKEREAKERDAKERRANEREAKEREDKERDAQARRQEQVARDRDMRDREAQDRRRQDRSRSARRGSDGRIDRGDGRSRREDGSNRRDRRENRSPGGDRDADSFMRSGSPEESTQDDFKRKASKAAFTDLLISSGAVTATSTYEDLERLLGDDAAWRDCDAEARRYIADGCIDCIKNMP